MSWVYLSHVLDDSTPLYGGNGRVKIVRTRSISDGDVSNNSDISMPAHAGTHIDAPRHFDQYGPSLEDFPPEFWQTHEIWLIDCLCEPGEILDRDRLQSELANIPVNCKLLLMRTGAEHWRTHQPDIYMKQGPGIGVDVAKWLRQNRRLKYLGMDFISTSSFMHREIGHETHKEFLASCDAKTPPILLIEDMALDQLEGVPSLVWIVPLRYTIADGAPVTVMARMENSKF